jgi:hypothetical protein
MRKRIKDEFADLPISRQRKYQLRMKKQGCCTLCGEPAATAAHCLFHAIQSRERNRAGKKSQRRYLAAQSYQFKASAPLTKAAGRRLNGNRSGIGFERLAKPAAKRAVIGL